VNQNPWKNKGMTAERKKNEPVAPLSPIDAEPLLQARVSRFGIFSSGIIGLLGGNLTLFSTNRLIRNFHQEKFSYN
jgi:hypothetical protein